MCLFSGGLRSPTTEVPGRRLGEVEGQSPNAFGGPDERKPDKIERASDVQPIHNEVSQTSSIRPLVPGPLGATGRGGMFLAHERAVDWALECK